MVRSADQVEIITAAALELLGDELPIRAAILFGSHVDGTAHADSDIDLAVFTDDQSRLTRTEKARLQLQLQKRCAMDLELHLYPSRALDQARPTNFYGYLLKHGRRLR